MSSIVSVSPSPSTSWGQRPWTESKSIADGAAIRSYIRDTARERGVDEKIRFHHEVLSAEWSTADARWTVTTAAGITFACHVYTLGAFHEVRLTTEPDELVYARVDVARDEHGQPLVMELELIEPSLFLRQAPTALERLVDAVVRRLK